MAYNIYRDLGCSQEDHLPNCGHFGYTGEYLSRHAEGCPTLKDQPCNCNPNARMMVEKTKLNELGLARMKSLIVDGLDMVLLAKSAEHPKVKDMYFGLAFAYYGAANDMYSTLPELSDFIYDENFTKLRIAIRDSHVFP
jgi:hypothetical protein